VAASAVASDPARAATVFTSGSFTLPEAIVAAPGGGYLVSDADNDNISVVPATGGAATSTDPVGFRVFGEVQLTSNYGADAGMFLAYGTNNTDSNGVAALVGTSGLAAPNTVINASSTYYDGATVASSSYGSIAANSIVITNQPGPTSSIEVLAPNLSGTTTFATLPGIAAFGVGFAPSTFGAHAGQLFVSDSLTGNIYTLSTTGQPTLFATLPLPAGFKQPGLRQFAWAPANFGTYGGDLFVSVAAQNGGGGSTGEIDVLNAQGQTVDLYDQGNSAFPLDPRGLDFIGPNLLLAANADPGIDLLTPADFLPAAQVLPEPGSLPTLLAGLGGIVALRQARLWRRRPASYAT
jgi:hypothetical protein